MESLRPGESLDLVLDCLEERPEDIRRVSLLELLPKRGLVVSQPLREIRKSFLNQRIEASVLRRANRNASSVRVGFHTAVKEILAEYKLVRSTTSALILAIPKEVHRANLRFAYRLEIPSTLLPPVALLNELKRPISANLNLLDLSATGALVNYRRERGETVLFQDGNVMYFEVDLRGLLETLEVEIFSEQSAMAQMILQCRVVRSHEETQSRLHYGALNFIGATEQQRDLLHAVIVKIQQHLASDGNL